MHTSGESTTAVTSPMAPQPMVGLAAPQLSSDAKARLHSLRTSTVLIRGKLSQVVQDLELTREVLEIEAAAAPADDDIQVLLRDVLSDVDEAMERLVQGVARHQRVLRERPERLVVAFFGRTMAGKSTLVETLSGGTGEAIGVGGQRTTRKTRYCDWGDVVLLDTPGIGAFRGEKDARIARQDVRDADLVVFVLTDDSIQEELFQGFEHVRAENKPVLFVLNVKLDLQRPVYRKRFLRNPTERMGTQALQGHRDRLDELASERLGLRSYLVVPVHAQAAWLSRTDDDPALEKASGVGQIVAAVTDLVTRDAVPLRIRSTFDPSILEIERVGDKLAYLRDDSAGQQRIYEERAAELDRRLRQIQRTHERRVDRTIKGHLGARRTQLREWFEENIRRKDLEERFDRWLAVEELQEALERDLLETASAIEDACAAAVAALEVDLTDHFRRSAGLEPFETADWRKVLTRISQGLHVVGVLASVALFVRAASFWNPVSWALLALTQFLGWLARRFPHLNVVRRQYITTAVRKTDQRLESLEEAAAQQAKEPIQQLIAQGQPRRLLRSFQDGSEKLRTVVAMLNAGTTAVRRSSVALGSSLCGELLGDGLDVELWGRLPGEILAPRSSLEPAVEQRLANALDEQVLPLEGTRTESIRQLFDGARVSWRRHAVRVAPPDGSLEGLESRIQLAERIAERPVEMPNRTEAE